MSKVGDGMTDNCTNCGDEIEPGRDLCPDCQAEEDTIRDPSLCACGRPCDPDYEICDDCEVNCQLHCED